MGIVSISFVVLLAGILGAYYTFVVRPEEQQQRAFWKRLKAKAPTREMRSNLLKHASGWPDAADLDARVSSGQPAYGMAAAGPDKMSSGAEAMKSRYARATAGPRSGLHNRRIAVTVVRGYSRKVNEVTTPRAISERSSSRSRRRRPYRRQFPLREKA